MFHTIVPRIDVAAGAIDAGAGSYQVKRARLREFYRNQVNAASYIMCVRQLIAAPAHTTISL